MKKILSILIAILLVFGVCACESKNKPKEIMYFEATKDDLINAINHYTDSLELRIISQRDNDTLTSFSIESHANYPNNDYIHIYSNKNGNVTGLDFNLNYIFNEALNVYEIPSDNCFFANEVISYLANKSGVKEARYLIDMYYATDKDKTIEGTWENINYSIEYKSENAVGIMIFPKVK